MAKKKRNEKKQSPKQQLRWYFEQAAAGDTLAKRELGRMHLFGFTHDEDPSVEVLPDADIARHWLTAATDDGDDEAAYLLGLLLSGGGFPFDEPEEAFHLFRKAVDRGSRSARSYLAAAYLLGRGIRQNEQLGREMMIEAAYGGDTDAMRMMGAICEKSGDETGASAWQVLASLFDEDEGKDIVGLRIPADTPQRLHYMIEKANLYSRLVLCDTPVLVQAADLVRESFREELTS